MKYLVAVLLSCFTMAASAQMPGIGNTGTGAEVTTAGGASCRAGTQRTTVDFGVMSKSYDDSSMQQPINNPYFGGMQQAQESGMVYARVTIPLGAKKGRVDCNRMYNLEIERMKNENELLRRQLQQMQNSAIVISVD